MKHLLHPMFTRILPKKKEKSSYEKLRQKWSIKHEELHTSLWETHKEALDHILRLFPSKQQLASGSLGGLLLLTTIPLSKAEAKNMFIESVEAQIDKSAFLVSDLYSIVPKDVRPLNSDEEKNITSILSLRFNLPVRAELEGKRLERNFGFIGQEQHLMRYPGDTISTHFTKEEDVLDYAKYGMAPGRGAWGYFSHSYDEMTEKDIEREKWYIAVPTFLAPGFNENVSEMYAFFKYRKMLVINPHNGKAVVTVIADAGPAEWTGKHLGGSPEVMRYLERFDGRQKGAVLYFFLDDPNDTIPLGPVNE